jgi:manganese oxidase
MLNKNILIITTFAVATVLISPIILGSLPGASSVYAQTFPGFIPSQAPTTYQHKVTQYDHQKNCATDQHTETTFKSYLTHFACGRVTVLNNGTTLRKFTLIADDFNGTGKPIAISTNTYGLGKPLTSSNQTYKPVIFHAWTFNGTVPGPTMRFTQGDHVQITVINAKDSEFPHSLHMHSMHPGPIDGMSGLAGMIMPGHSFTYSFVANPVGVYPYHCHMSPVEEHIARGLYGMMIIDPPTPRAHATEMVMMLNSYTYSFEGVNGSGHFTPTIPASMHDIQQNLSDVIQRSDEGNGPDNQFYSVNGMPFGYVGKDSVHLTTGTPYRIYLANMVEFDPVNSFHMHGNMFYYTPSATTESAKMYTDIVTIGQGDRGMIEFHYNFPGQFMFHSHINHFSDLGWIGFFNVTKSKGNGNVTPE